MKSSNAKADNPKPQGAAGDYEAARSSRSENIRLGSTRRL